MVIRVRIPGVLRRYSGGDEEVVVEGDTVAAALERVFARHPDLRERVLDKEGALRPYLLLFREGERIGLETALSGDDLIEVVGAAEGG